MIDFPNSPTVGQVVTSPSGTAWRWTGSTWLLGTAASAGGARGTVAYAQVTANQAGILASSVDIVGLSATFNAVAGRTYKVTAKGTFTSTTINDVFTMTIKSAAGATLQLVESIFGVAATAMPLHAEYVFTAAATAATTMKVSANRQVGTGTCTFFADPTIPAFILVEDITYDAGPGGAAARVATGGTAFPWAGTVPASTSLLTQTGVFNGTTTSGGLVTVPWPVAFTTQVVSFFTQSITLAGYYIPVNRAAITLTGVQLVAFNVNGTVVASGAIDLAYTVTGW